MKSLVILVLWAIVCLGTELTEEIQRAQSLLAAEGPSTNVLDEFNRVIHKIESESEDNNNDQVDKVNTSESQTLSQLYFKKSLIEMTLNKERDAIKTLHKCLALDPYLKPAQSKLIDLLLEFGLFDDPVFSQLPSDHEAMVKIHKFNMEYQKMETLLQKGHYDLAAGIIENDLLPVSPANSSLYKYQIEALTNLDPSVSDSDSDWDPLAISRTIILAYTKLVKLESVKNLSNYRYLSDFLLYTQVNFQKAFANVKQCLRIDNEYSECAKLSKFYSKFKLVFEQLEAYSIELSHIYLENENSASIDFVDLNDKVDFKFIIQFLFNEKPTKRQLTGIRGSINSNYDYLMYFVNEFKQSAPYLSQTLPFTIDLDKLICEGYIQTHDYKAADNACRKLSDDSNSFLPKFIPQIDKLLAKKKYNEVDSLMKRFPVNTRQTKLFQSRYEKVEAYLQEQQRKHQQEQQQRFYQQQQQQQQQRQQYRQQAPPRSNKPKTDYYKILGISKDADERTIKKAHRTQTLKYHPDKYKGNDLTPEQIESKMQEINKAYEVLSNPELKERYDRGDDPNDPMGGGGGGPGGASPFSNSGGFAGGNPFGGSGGGGGFQFHFGNGFNFGGFGNQGPKMKFQKNFKKRKP